MAQDDEAFIDSLYPDGKLKVYATAAVAIATAISAIEEEDPQKAIDGLIATMEEKRDNFTSNINGMIKHIKAQKEKNK